MPVDYVNQPGGIKKKSVFIQRSNLNRILLNTTFIKILLNYTAISLHELRNRLGSEKLADMLTIHRAWTDK